MRDTTKALTKHYVDQLDLSGKVLEVGGHRRAECAIELFGERRFAYHSLSREASKIPYTITADITDCRDAIPDESFDLVMSTGIFEHIDRPWLAAAEIGRILKPGGLAITHTLFAWRDHPGPIDYWRYTPESLEFLFGDLQCLEKGYDLSEPQEHRSVYLVSRKGSGPAVTRFTDSGHPLARRLRRDPGEVVADARFSKTESPPPDPLEAVRPALAEMTDRLVGLEKLVENRISQLDAIDIRSRRLERRIDRAVASFPFRTVLSVRRGLHRMLK